MRQILIQWGPCAIPSYGFFIALGIIVALHLGEKQGRKVGLRKFLVLDAGIIAVLGGILGAKVFYLAFAEKGSALHTGEGGRAFFAGLAAALLVGIGFLKLRRAPILKTLDVAFLYLPLGHAIGRIGCLCYGCCFGRVCPADFPLALRFPVLRDFSGQIAGTPPFQKHLELGWVSAESSHSLPVYPTQILAIVSACAVFAVLRWLAGKPSVQSRPGAMVSLYCILYGAVRWVEEIFRDTYRYWGVLSKAQLVSSGLVIGGAIALYILFRKGSNLP